MKKSLLVVLTTICAVVLTACGGAAGPAGSTNLDHEVAVTFPDREEGKAPYSVTLNYLVDGWEYPAESSAAAWSPGKEKELLNLNITVKNTGADQITVEGREFSLWLGDTNYASWYADAASVPSAFTDPATVAPGDSYTANLLYELPADADLSALEFDVYRSNVGRGEETEVKLGDVM